MKNAIFSRDHRKEGHRGTQFQIVGESHDVLYLFSDVLQKRLAALLQPSAQNRMIKISHRFLPRLNRILLRHRTVPQSRNLREDVPYPMGLLSSPLQFFKGEVISRGLSDKETL